VYEEDFYDFSYGFRPGRSAHQALEALDKALYASGKTCWVLDVDVKSFFDTIDRRKLRDILTMRVIDGPVVRMVGKWLRAGVLEGGVVHHTDRGTPQGGVISPLLANIYLHTVLDHWWATEVQPRLDGRAWLVRYADDFVVVFERRGDALRVQEVLPKRFERFGLTLHPEKTRLVRFKPPQQPGAGGRGSSFDFLGFTFHPKRSRGNHWIPAWKTSRKSFTKALRALDQWMRRHRHLPVPDQARAINRRLRGHYAYFGVAYNSRAVQRFAHHARRRWFKWLNRRSQRSRLDWEAFNRLLQHHPLMHPRVRRGWCRP